MDNLQESVQESMVKSMTPIDVRSRGDQNDLKVHDNMDLIKKIMGTKS